MKNYNYEKVGLMLDYINGSKDKVEPLELIAKFIPSMYELNIIYNKNFKGQYNKITIDMQDKSLKGAIRKSYELKNELESTEVMIKRYLGVDMKKEDIAEGQKVYCKEYGNGEITKLFEYELMFVKFESKKLPVMCSQKGYTVHDDTKRKLTKR